MVEMKQEQTSGSGAGGTARPRDLSGRRALVCGASQGIGRACAEELAARGAAITLVARDAHALETVRAALPAPSSLSDPVASDPAGSAPHASDPAGGHQVLAVDFQDPAALRARVSALLARHGPHVILVNNTGGPPGGPLLEADPEALLAALRMHVVCNQLLVQLTVPGMKQARYGRIVNIISTSVREPIPNLGVSNTTRGAVASWAKTLSRELGPHGITVNNVLPGFTDTQRLHALIAARAVREGRTEAQVRADMEASIPLGRFAHAAEIAAAVGFLAAPTGSYVNGVSLPVDGGRLLSI